MSGEAPESGGRQPPTDPPVAVQVPDASIHVFISYASQDTAVADAIVEALERHGLKCWIAPRDVKGGALYADAIVRAISGAKAFVLVLSESAIASSHVSKEIERASSKRRPIIALRIDAAPLTPALEYFLSESQWIEAQAGNIDAAYIKLIDAIRDPARTAPRHSPAVPLEVSAARARAAHPALRFNWILLAAGTVFVVAALAALLVDKFRISSHVTQEKPAATTSPVPAAGAPAQPTISEKSVAVLPFTDMSEKKDQEYLSDGLSEQLIDMLTKIPDLRVPARTSSFYFKGKSEDISTIARKLLVAHVLEGSVRKSGKHLRITVQLVRTDNGYHQWSETYDRQLDDVFKVEDEIARAVVSALKVSLLTGTTLRSPPTSSIEAYTLYLEYFFLSRRGTKADLGNAIDKLRRAVQLDPTFALAWADLSRSLTEQAQSHYLPFEEIHDEAARAANQALKLDRTLASAHIAIGKQRLYFDGDWAGADAEFKQALRLDPGDADTLRWAATTAECYGRFEDARGLLEQAVNRDPLLDANLSQITEIYVMLGRFHDAEAAARKAMEVNPQNSDNHLGVAYVLLAEGKLDEALAEARLAQDPEWRLGMEAIVHHALGRTADADAALAQFREKYGRGDPYGLAQIYARRGERSQALAELDRAATGGRVAVAFCTGEVPGAGVIKGDLSFNALRDDPRFKALLRKIKLPE